MNTQVIFDEVMNHPRLKSLMHIHQTEEALSSEKVKVFTKEIVSLALETKQAWERTEAIVDTFQDRLEYNQQI